MSLNKKVGVLAGAASVAVTGASFAGGGVPADGTDARIKALEGEIAELKAEQSNWLSSNDEQIRALVQDVIADSETRSSLLRDGHTAGWDDGFFLSSADGDFVMKFFGQSQFRYVWNNRDDDPSTGDNDEFGFEMRRMKLGIKGNLFGKDLTYKVNGAFDRGGGDFVLEDAWFRYDLGEGWNFRWGQFKAPFLREELMSSSKFQAVDRTYANELANQGGRTQGVELAYEGDGFRFNVAFTDGWDVSYTGTNSTFANTGFSTDGTDFNLAARAEAVLAGDAGFGQFDDYSSWNDDTFGWLLGGALYYQADETGTSADNGKHFGWTVDTQLEFGGANLAAAVFGQHSDDLSGGDFDQYGFTAQGGVFLAPDKFEFFANYSYYDFDSALGSGVDDETNIFGLGFNWFFEGHKWKWTTDVLISGDAIPVSSTGIGVLADAQDDQFVFRTQMQVLF